jgi:MFS family permease
VAAEDPGSLKSTRPAVVVGLLALVLFINYVDRGAVPTAAPLIQQDLHLDDEQLGRMLSAFFWTYTWVQIPVGWLAERFGAHRVLAAGLVLWSAATMLTGAASGFAILIGLRMLLGVGESVGFPTVSKLVAAVAPIEKLGNANGIVGFGYLLAPGVGIWLAGRLIDSVGWRGTFVVFGMASLLWLLPWAAVKLPKLATAQSDASTPRWGMVLSQRALWGTSLGLFSSNYLWYFMLSWLPTILVKARGFSMHEMEHVATLGYLVNGLSALVVGWSVDRYISGGHGSANFGYKFIMVVTHLGSVPCMLAMALGSQSTAVAGMFGFQFLMGAASPGMYAMSQILAGARASGRWVGIQNCIGNCSGPISPWISGVIVQRTGHFTLAFFVCAAVSVVGLIGWIGMVPKLAPIQWWRDSVPDSQAQKT